MGLLGFGAQVLTTYKADITDHQDKLRRLHEEERRGAEDRQKGVSAHNLGIDSIVKKLGEWDAALDLVVKAGEFAFNAMEQSARRAQLQVAAGTTNLERLSAAAGGTASKMELLELAAAGQTSAMKLSQGQMETAERAMRALTLEGKNHEEVTKRVTDAVIKLEGDGLKDLGIRVREATDDVGKFNAIMEALEEKSRGAHDGQVGVGEAVAGLKAKFKDAQDAFIDGVGRLASSMGPLLDSLGKTVGLVERLAHASQFSIAGTTIPGTNMSVGDAFQQGGFDAIRSLYEHVASGRGVTEAQRQAIAALARSFGGVSYPLDANLAMPPSMQGTFSIDQYKLLDLDRERLLEAERENADTRLWEYEHRKELAAEAAAAFAATRAGMHERFLGRGTDHELSIDFTRRTRAVLNGDLGPGQRGATLSPGEAYVQTDELGFPVDLGDQLHRQIQTGEANRRAGAKSKLEQLFGPIEHFSAYQKAFEALTGSVSAAMTAWINGSKTAGAAIRGFLGELVKGLAVQMAVEAIKHGAYAIAALVPGPTFDPPAAAGHAKAAAAFAAGSVFAAAAARGLHGGGDAPGASSGGGGAGGGSAAYAAPALPPPKQQVIVIGNSWARQTPRAQALEAEELVHMAEGTSAGGHR